MSEHQSSLDFIRSHLLSIESSAKKASEDSEKTARKMIEMDGKVSNILDKMAAAEKLAELREKGYSDKIDQAVTQAEANKEAIASINMRLASWSAGGGLAGGGVLVGIYEVAKAAWGNG